MAGGIIPLRLLSLLIFLLPAVASATMNYYAGCGNGPDATRCLNQRELDRIAARRTLEIISHGDRTEARVSGGSGGTPGREGVPVGGTTNVFTDPSNPGGEPGGGPQADIKPIEKPGASAGTGLENATEVDQAAQQKAIEQAALADRQAAEHRHIAEYQRALADTMARQYDNLNAFVQPRQASTEPRLQAEAASRLREMPVLPERFRDLSGASGLRSNGEFRSRAPEMVERISDDSERQDHEAARLELDAKRGRLAAKQLAEFRDTLGRRVSNMESVNGNGALAGSVGLSGVTGGKPGSRDFGKGPKSSQSDITASSDADLKSGKASAISSGGSRGLASVAESAGAASVGPDGVKGAKRESLRDALRRKLAAKDGKDRGSESDPKEGSATVKSSFAQFFEDKNGEGGGAAGSEGERGARSQSGFFLSGPETDQVVAKFVGSIDGGSQFGSSEVFGDSSVNIFQRMSNFLRKCQAEKKVAATRP